MDCFDQAAKDARKRYANSAAAAWLRRAMALLGESNPARRFNLLDRLQTIADTVGDRPAQDAGLAEMAQLLERYPDDVRQAKLWFSLAVLADRRGDHAASERLALRAFELAEHCGGATTAASAQGLRAWLRLARQDPPGRSRFAGDRSAMGLQDRGRGHTRGDRGQAADPVGHRVHRAVPL